MNRSDRPTKKFETTLSAEAQAALTVIAATDALARGPSTRGRVTVNRAETLEALILAERDRRPAPTEEAVRLARTAERERKTRSKRAREGA